MDLELLTDSILTHWKPQDSVDLENILLDEINIIQAQSDTGHMYYY